MVDVNDESSGDEDEIEQAYQKALAALQDVPWDAEAEQRSAEVDVSDVPQSVGETALELPPISVAVTATDASAVSLRTEASEPRLAAGTDRQVDSGDEERLNVTPAQVIEAALFVGGAPLTAKKICGLLRGSIDAATVERMIEELNERYVAEGRPYEIRLGEGGFRLDLRPEFERVRLRAYGAGPREVKLSQDVVEVLALVAYRQPLSQQEIETHGKANSGSLLRQLLRRDLISIQRGEGGRKDIRYLTTPRFLTVFGLGSLDELPEPEDLARK